MEAPARQQSTDIPTVNKSDEGAETMLEEQESTVYFKSLIFNHKVDCITILLLPNKLPSSIVLLASETRFRLAIA
jgi:hypothetical protein